MFSPLENERSEQWFQQLNAPLKRLPAAERTELHAEVRQHLEALAAANEELGSTSEEAWHLALTQFGDPGSFGKKMAQEWQQGKTGFRADMTAILACFGIETLLGFSGSWIIQWLAILWVSRYHYVYPSSLFAVTNDTSLYVIPIAILVLIGRKFPFQALKGVFYVRVFSLFCRWLFIGVYACLHPSMLHPPSLAMPPSLTMLAHGLLWSPVWLTVVYLASVTKRGWYRPSWADFKITLPKRRRQVG